MSDPVKWTDDGMAFSHDVWNKFLESLPSFSMKVEGCFFPPTEDHLKKCDSCKNYMIQLELAADAASRRN